MKSRNTFVIGLMLCSLFFVTELAGQSFVKDVKITTDETTVYFEKDPARGYLLEIGGPEAYYWRKSVFNLDEIKLKNLNSAGEFFPDGQYTLQVTPLFVVSEDDKKEMRRLSDQNEHRQLVEYRKKLNIPEDVQFYNFNFRIEKGKFVFPYLNEESIKKPLLAAGGDGPYNKHLGLYASIEEKANYGLGLTTRAWDNTRIMEDQVIMDDLIVDGSLCVGFDCVNGESFGFDTQRLKENNLRIKFQDTSSSASFPTNDWQITANDSSNGGQNKFSIDDIDGGRTPFTIEAGAPSHSLYVDDVGRIGIGTSTPVVELHNKDGDTPTLRLEQDGSSGFTPQTWDLAGNEANFFIRDATNGSTLPFRIKPGAPSNSLFVDTDGDIGLGTASPSARLDVVGNAEINGVLDVVGNAEINGRLVVIDTTAMTLPLGTTAQRPVSVEGMLRGNSTTNLPEYYDGTSWLELGAAAGGGGIWSTNGTDVFRTTGNVGIGTTSPSFNLEVCGTIGTTSASVITGITCSSDIRFKKNIAPLEGALQKVLQLEGVHYDWRINEFPEKHFNEGRQIGFIAQEMEKIYPEVVKTEPDGYKSLDYSRLTPILVEAIKDQQKIIDSQQAEIVALQSSVADLKDLKEQVAQLTQMVMSQNESAATEELGKE